MICELYDMDLTPDIINHHRTIKKRKGNIISTVIRLTLNMYKD